MIASFSASKIGPAGANSMTRQFRLVVLVLAIGGFGPLTSCRQIQIIPTCCWNSFANPNEAFMNSLRKTIFGLLGAAIGMTALHPAQAQEVNVYSLRQPFLIEPMFKRFTKETGIKVNTLFRKAVWLNGSSMKGATARRTFC